jgi:Uma2 family endonuclease
MSTVVQQVTAEELLKMPDDVFRYQLVRGELKKMPPTGHVHGRVAMKFAWRLAQHVETNNLGNVFAAETGFLIKRNPDTVRAPDCAFVSRQRLQAIGEAEGYLPCAPDLAVEVLSPGDTYTEVEEKAFDWLASGSLVVLVLNPRKRTITVYKSRNDITILDENSVLDLSDVVADCRVPIRVLFD